jgi:hypothetical protein
MKPIPRRSVALNSLLILIVIAAPSGGEGREPQALATFEDIATQRPWSDVRAFGAKGDGTADDTAAIQAAINFAAERHAVAYFPPGSYRITSRLRVPPNASLQGVGVGFGSALRPVATDAITILGKDHRGGFGFRNRIRGLTIMMNDARASKAIEIDTAYSVKLEDVFVYESGAAGGIVIVNAQHVSMEDVSVYGTGSGDGVHVSNSDVSFYDLDVEGVVNGMVVTSSEGVHLFGGHFERFGAYAIRFEGSSFNSVMGARLSGSNNGTIGLGFLDFGKTPSNNNTIIASNLTNPAVDATAVFEDADSTDNTLLNCHLQGALRKKGHSQ